MESTLREIARQAIHGHLRETDDPSLNSMADAVAVAVLQEVAKIAIPSRTGDLEIGIILAPAIDTYLQQFHAHSALSGVEAAPSLEDVAQDLATSPIGGVVVSDAAMLEDAGVEAAPPVEQKDEIRRATLQPQPGSSTADPRDDPRDDHQADSRQEKSHE